MNEQKRHLNKIRKTIRLVLYDWQTLFGFEVVYKLISVSMIVPLLKMALNGVMYVTGYEYLTTDNIRPFLQNPITILFILLVMFLVFGYSMIDIAAVIYIIDCSKKGIDTNVFAAFRYGLRSMFRLYRPKNLGFILVLLVMIPVTHIGAFSGYVITISIPDFIEEYLYSHWHTAVILAAAYLILGILMLSWLFAFHYFCLENANFMEARRKSAHGRGNKRERIRDFLWVIGIQLLLLSVFIILSLVGILVILLIRGAARSVGITNFSYSTIVYRFMVTAVGLMEAVSVPLTYAMISTLYYAEEELSQALEERQRDIYLEVHQRNRRRVVIETVLAAAAVAVFCWYSWRTVFGHFNVNAQYIHQVEVTAHRGSSIDYPENTMAAFRAAVLEGADWIELDVQQSADGEIFVMHDTNFLRTAGVDAVPWEMTWEEISELDVGSWFSEDFAGEKIPLLEDVINMAKLTGVRLNIELKPTGHETEFEQSVVDIVEAAGFESDCVVTSQQYSVLQKIKSCNSSIRTVYVMSIAYGSIDKLIDADDYSIEETFATKSLIRRMHNSGHQVMVWTVNSRKNIRSAIDSGADNIITDNVVLASACVDEAMAATGLKILLNQLRDILTF